jgi:hypothetical protein
MVMPGWNCKNQVRWLDRTRPKPRWLMLEPGEEYLGSYPRWGKRSNTVASALGIGLMPAVAGILGDNSPLPTVCIILLPLTAVALAAVVSYYNRVYLTSKALVYRESGQFHMIELARITGLSFGSFFKQHSVYVQLAGANGRSLELMDSPRPRQAAEELSQLIAQYGGRAVNTGGAQ